MKLSKARLLAIIKEELFYREFYRSSSEGLREQAPSTSTKGTTGAAAPAAKPANQSIGQKVMTKQQQAKSEFEKAQAIRKGNTLGDVTGKERAILMDVEKILTAVAEKDDLNKYRSVLQNVVNSLRKKAGV